MIAHRVSDIRAAEAALAATLPEGALMQRAATGLAVACAGRLGRVYGSRVVLLVGGGNNGADALWAGAQLARRGAAVTAVLAGTAELAALAALRAAGGRVGGTDDLAEADLVVDGLVGIGGDGPLRGPAAELAAAGDDVVAVDLPSGVDADTGQVHGPAVHAGLTVTFGSGKVGLYVGAGAQHAGQVHLVDIGLEPHLGTPALRGLDARAAGLALPVHDASTDKFRRGVVGVAAGSPRYGGAAVLACGAALQAGAGLVRFVGENLPANQVRAHWPEVVVTEALAGDADGVRAAGRVQAWVVGPGLGTDDAAGSVVRAVLEQDVPVVVDADALTLCAQHPQWLRDRGAPTVLTPHDAEFARFGQAVGADRLGAAQALAENLGVTVLLKGAATVVACPGQVPWVNTTGSPVLATAGSGDVLAGAVGALLAQGVEAQLAAALAAHLHGMAGAASAYGGVTTAQRVLAAWPRALEQLTDVR